MTRDEFTTEFAARLRFVVQKHDRVNAMLAQTDLDGTEAQRRLRVSVAQVNLDAAIGLFADFVWDAFESLAQHGGLQLS